MTCAKVSVTARRNRKEGKYSQAKVKVPENLPFMEFQKTTKPTDPRPRGYRNRRFNLFLVPSFKMLFIQNNSSWV